MKEERREREKEREKEKKWENVKALHLLFFFLTTNSFQLGMHQNQNWFWSFGACLISTKKNHFKRYDSCRSINCRTCRLRGVRVRVRVSLNRITPSYLRLSFRPCLRNSSGKFGIILHWIHLKSIESYESYQEDNFQLRSNVELN